jgi:hypothetical protein
MDPDPGRIRSVLRGWIRIRSEPDRIPNIGMTTRIIWKVRKYRYLCYSGIVDPCIRKNAPVPLGITANAVWM